MRIYLYAQLFVYILGSATAIPLWFLLFRRGVLHENFRAIIFLASVAGQGVAIPMYAYGTYYFASGPDLNDKITVPLFNACRLFTTLFQNTCLCLCIERAVAAKMVETYEHCVSTLVTIIILTALTVFSFGFGYVLHIVYNNLDYIGIVVVAYSITSFAVTISIWFYRRSTKLKGGNATLQKKFQQCENARTFPIYFCISVNELACCTTITILNVIIANALKDFNIVLYADLSDVIQLIDAYRIVFVNLVVIVSWYWHRRSRGRSVVQSLMPEEEAKQYFEQLQRSWSAPNAFKTGSSAKR